MEGWRTARNRTTASDDCTARNGQPQTRRGPRNGSEHGRLSDTTADHEELLADDDAFRPLSPNRWQPLLNGQLRLSHDRRVADQPLDLRLRARPLPPLRARLIVR